MKLLQVPTALLEQRIKEEMEVNPALEESNDEYADEQVDFDASTDAASAEEAATNSEVESEETQYSEDNFDLDEYLNGYMEDDPASYKERGESYQADEEDKSVPVAIENSFHEYLEQQISLLNLSTERDHIIATQIIGSIDEDGYLRREPYAIADDLLFSQNLMIEEKEIVDILKKIQRLDPPGIGARDLQECLYIQLLIRIEQGEDLDDEELIALKAACKIINRQFEAFSKKWNFAELIHAPDQTQPVVQQLFSHQGNQLQRLTVLAQGTNFQLKVWEALLRIPAGAVSTYSHIARSIGQPKAQRAVGTAIGSNPVAFLIPCHRVIQSTGKLGGYHWGETRKSAIVGWEMAGGLKS